MSNRFSLNHIQSNSRDACGRHRETGFKDPRRGGCASHLRGGGERQSATARRSSSKLRPCRHRWMSVGKPLGFPHGDAIGAGRCATGLEAAPMRSRASSGRLGAAPARWKTTARWWLPPCGATAGDGEEGGGQSPPATNMPHEIRRLPPLRLPESRHNLSTGAPPPPRARERDCEIRPVEECTRVERVGLGLARRVWVVIWPRLYSTEVFYQTKFR